MTFDINHEDGDLPNRYNNIQELADVSLQQNALLGELKTIDDALDGMMP